MDVLPSLQKLFLKENSWRNYEGQVNSQLMLYPNKHFVFVFFSCFAWNFYVETATVQVNQQYTTCQLGNYTAPFEVTLATQLMFMQLGLQTLQLAYFQSLELFSITQLYIYVYIFFNQPFLPGREHH